MKKTLFLAISLSVFVPLVLIASSCQSESNTILIRIGEFYFEPETIQLKSGQDVKIELVNKGKLEHEFMVGRGVKMMQGNNEANEGMHEDDEPKQENSELEHEHHGGMHMLHQGMSNSFKKDFFESIKVVAQTENGAEFMEIPGHGTMVTLKPDSKAILNFKVPTNRKGEWEVACFVPGHYEADMKGKVIIN